MNFLYFIAFTCVLEMKDICFFFFPLKELAEQVPAPHQYSSPVICLIKLGYISYVFTYEIILFFLLSSSSCSPGCHAILSACLKKLSHCEIWPISCILAESLLTFAAIRTSLQYYQVDVRHLTWLHLGSLFCHSCYNVSQGVTWPCHAQLTFCKIPFSSVHNIMLVCI